MSTIVRLLAANRHSLAWDVSLCKRVRQQLMQKRELLIFDGFDKALQLSLDGPGCYPAFDAHACSSVIDTISQRHHDESTCRYDAQKNSRSHPGIALSLPLDVQQHISGFSRRGRWN